MKNFRDLKVWQKGHELTLKIYKVTSKFPEEEKYGLTSQMRRSAYAIPTNIAEGCGRRSEKELANFLSIARGSASELEYQLVLTNDLSFLSKQSYEELVNDVVEIKKMLTALIKKVSADG